MRSCTGNATQINAHLAGCLAGGRSRGHWTRNRTCIGCGASVAACPNASASLFTGAKISHLGLLPQGQPERHARALKMVQTAQDEQFGNCTNIGECEAVCPKNIPLEVIARMNGDFLKGSFLWRPDSGADSGT